MFRHYLSIAARNFARNKLSAAIGILSLALGLACFLGAYVFVSYVEDADRWFPHSERIYAMYQRSDVPAMGMSIPLSPGTSSLLADYLRTDFPQLEAVARSRVDNKALVTVDGRPSFRRVRFVEPDFLKIFELPFISGSAARTAGQARSAVLTQAAAKTLFGRTDVVGRTVRIGDLGDVQVAGVIADLPQPSQFGRSVTKDGGTELFVVTNVPKDITQDLPQKFQGMPGADKFFESMRWLGAGGFSNTYVLFPVDGSFTAAMLNAQLPAFTARHVTLGQKADNLGHVTIRFEAKPISDVYSPGLEDVVGGELGVSATDLLLAIGGLVLTVASLNFVNLATARSLIRAKEAGLRKVLGARRKQVALQHLCEGVLASALAMPIALLALGLAIAVVDRRTGLAFAAPWSSGFGFWAFVCALTLAVGAAAAAYPALVLARVAPMTALRAGGVRAGPKGLRLLLIGLQFAAASFLLIAVIIVAAQNRRLERSAASVGPDPLVVVPARLKDAGVDPELFRSRLLASPYIKAVTGAAIPPWENRASGSGYARTPGDPNQVLPMREEYVSYGYFAALGTRVLAGRAFSRERDPPKVRRDLLESSSEPAQAQQHNAANEDKADKAVPPKIVIDRLAARQFGWSNPEDAIGQTVYNTSGAAFGSKQGSTPRTIIGVVEHAPPSTLGVISRAYIYQLDDDDISYPIVVLRRGDVRAALAHIDAVWKDLAPDYPVTPQFADERFASSYRMFRYLNRAFATLAAFAFVIAVTGLLGMTVFISNRRRHEMGVRKVMGATRGRLFRVLLGDFLSPVIVANLVVWLPAFLAARAYVSLFMQPAALTLWPFLLSFGITMLIAILAVGRQALRLARLEPAGVLRYE